MNTMDSCYLEHALSQMSCHLEHFTQFPQYLQRSALKKLPLSRFIFAVSATEFIHYRDIFEKIQLIEITFFTNLYTVSSSILLIKKFLASNI